MAVQAFREQHKNPTSPSRQVQSTPGGIGRRDRRDRSHGMRGTVYPLCGVRVLAASSLQRRYLAQNRRTCYPHSRSLSGPARGAAGRYQAASSFPACPSSRASVGPRVPGRWAKWHAGIIRQPVAASAGRFGPALLIAWTEDGAGKAGAQPPGGPAGQCSRNRTPPDGQTVPTAAWL